jgi:Domain of unknown function (DUF5615)
MAQFYTDENFPQPVVEQLRELGHDVLTTLESGKAGQKIPDEEVLSFAAENNRVLLTLNRKHFIRLHSEQPNHAGIIVCTFDLDFVGQANRIHASLVDQPNISGMLVRINRPLQ